MARGLALRWLLVMQRWAEPGRWQTWTQTAIWTWWWTGEARQGSCSAAQMEPMSLAAWARVCQAGRLQQAVVADLTSDGLPDLLLVQAGEPAPGCTVWRAGVLWQWERVPGLGGSGVLAAAID